MSMCPTPLPPLPSRPRGPLSLTVVAPSEWPVCPRSGLAGGQDVTRGPWNHLILSTLRPTAYKATCPPPACGSAAEDIDQVHRTRYREGRPQGRLSYFQPPASAWPFNFQKALLRSIQAPANMGYRCYSNLRKAPSCSRLPALVPSLRNIRSITSTLAASVALAKRKLSKLRESWHCILSKEPGRDRRLREQWG
jgi:hypothetical protein